MSARRALWLAWGAVVALLAYPAASQTIGEQSGIMGGDSGFLRPVATGTLTIAAMPYARTVTCGSYTLTGTASGAGAVSWSASPSGASGSCTGTTSWSCVVSVAPDAAGEGVETITVSQSGGASDTETIGFYVAGAHSCFLAQSVDGNYNSSLADLDAVATWTNLGSSAKNVTQGTGSLQPVYIANLAQGQPAVRCDGGDRLTGATTTDWTFLSNGTDSTTDAVARRTGAATNQAIVSTKGSGATTARGSDVIFTATNSVITYGTGNSSAVVATTTSANNAGTVDLYHRVVATTDNDGGAGADVFLYVDGAATSAASTAAWSVNAGTALNICNSGTTATTIPMEGDVFSVLIYQSNLTSTQRDINEAVAEWALNGTFPVTVAANVRNLFIGDSLVAGHGGIDPFPTLAAPDISPDMIYNQAVAGTQTDQILTVWTAQRSTQDWFAITVGGGFNDLYTADRTVAQAYTALSTIYSEASADGVMVIALTVPPFKGATGWNSTKHQDILDLNDLIMADANVDVVVDYFTIVADPADQEQQLAALTNDFIHPSLAGSQAVADVWVPAYQGL